MRNVLDGVRKILETLYGKNLENFMKMKTQKITAYFNLVKLLH